MKEIYVADLPGYENQKIDSFFVVNTRQVRARKDGGQYLAATLCDHTGQVESRMWENVSDAEFEAGDVIKVRATVCRYNGRFQLVLDRVRRASEDEFDLADYLPHTPFDIDELWADLNRWVDSFTSRPLKTLVKSILEDERIAKQYRQAPAAKAIHHAWLGGLLEHVVSLLGMCDAAAAHYPGIQRDLLLTGAILHDIGKIEELGWDRSFHYTLPGQLLGHITLGIALIEDKIHGLPDFPPGLRLLVEHMVLSHHGKLEFGSPKPPMIPEAILLHYLDDLDAKMQTVSAELARHQAQGARAEDLTEWVRALDRPLLSSEAYLRTQAEAEPSENSESQPPAEDSRESAVSDEPGGSASTLFS